ncbi:unnamed protein product [Urochloa humidicola]
MGNSMFRPQQAPSSSPSEDKPTSQVTIFEPNSIAMLLASVFLWIIGFSGSTSSHSGSGCSSPPPKPQDDANFVLRTLPVDPRAVSDGDTLNVFVDTTADPREAGSVPAEVRQAAAERDKARAAGDHDRADALYKTIVDSGYRPIRNAGGDEVLAKRYRIRLRGIDAPESAMPYGREAKEEFLKLVEGKSLEVHVYDVDFYGRCIGDIYNDDGIFVQEHMLKEGFAWHYAAYDKRPELAEWQNQAQADRKGLWASPNPQAPWDWRKENRNKAA